MLGARKFDCISFDCLYDELYMLFLKLYLSWLAIINRFIESFASFADIRLGISSLNKVTMQQT